MSEFIHKNHNVSVLIYTSVCQSNFNIPSACCGIVYSLLVAQQKDVCAAANITPETLRRKILEGHLTPLTRDGSTLNFITFKQMLDLKPHIRRKRKRANTGKKENRIDS